MGEDRVLNAEQENEGAKIAQSRRALFRLLAGALSAVCGLVLPSQGAAVSRLPDPVSRIELESMGYQGLQQDFLVAGSPMLTVNFVDAKHLLVTFEVHRLMKREAGAPSDDQDRTVKACLVEVASGKVLASTEWRLHDRSQYLWSLGDGNFLLRIRDHLSLIAPMAAAPTDAFLETQFLSSDRRIVAVLVSADHDLLTVESVNDPMRQLET